MTTTTQQVKIALLAGRKLTVRDIDRMCSTNNGAEVINRLRKSGMSIETQWAINDNTGKRYGIYSWIRPKKVNRIINQTYHRA